MPGSALDISDQHLMMLVQAGQVRAFEALVERHRAAASSFASYGFGPDLADDVVQAAFVSLWQHRAKYRPELGSLRTWLLTIVRHRGIDLIRSRASRQRHVVSLDPGGWIGLADESSVSEPAHEQLERAEAAVEVRALLSELPLVQRVVIELSFFEGLSQQQIADRLALPLGTVKGRMRLGMGRLRSTWARRDSRDSHRALLAA
jgi:RNA polymerase sigma-70 factor (ECF subfamily)